MPSELLEKTFYALGLQIASQLKTFRMTETEVTMVQAGLKDGILGTPPKVDLETYGPKIGPLAQSRALAAAGENKTAGKAFADKFAKEAGASRTASGLIYQVVQEGTGATPKAADTVKVHYHGTLIDGTVFDSSVKRGEPISFPVGGVIRGWTEALQLMKVGDKWQLFFPSELAYGPRRAGELIGPDSVLFFEIELLGIGE